MRKIGLASVRSVCRRGWVRSRPSSLPSHLRSVQPAGNPSRAEKGRKRAPQPAGSDCLVGSLRRLGNAARETRLPSIEDATSTLVSKTHVSVTNRRSYWTTSLYGTQHAIGAERREP